MDQFSPRRRLNRCGKTLVGRFCGAWGLIQTVNNDCRRGNIMLRWRLILGFSISAFIIGLCALDVWMERLYSTPGLALFPLLILLVILGVREMLGMANRNRVEPVPYVTYLGCCLIVTSAWGTFVIQHSASDSNSDSSPEVTRTFVADVSAVVSDAVPAVANQVASTATLTSASTVVSTVSSVGESLENGERPVAVTQRKLLRKLEHLTPGNWALSTFALVVILVFLQEMWTFRRASGIINIRISYTVFTIVYVGLLPTFLAQIRLCYGLPWLIAFIAIVKMGDVGAFTVGKLFGRNKMAPSLSPGKTIEGAVGALLFSIGTSLLFYFWILPTFGVTELENIGWWIAFGGVLCMLGMLGDLAESLMKRDAEIKDSGTLVPGFGGVLDILDSLLLAAPAAYAFLSLDLLFS